MKRQEWQMLCQSGTEEIRRRLTEARREHFNLRFQQGTRRLENPARLRQARKDVARLLTLIRQRERAGG